MAKSKKIFISFFIILNMLAMIRIHLPLNTKYFSGLYRPIDSYLSFFSIYQDWMMFAPNPGRINATIEAQVEFENGDIEQYYFPKQAEMNLIEKYTYGEKFRKIISEGIRKDENSFMWKDTAKFVLRQLRDQKFEHIPVKVHLIRKWDEIPDPEKEFRMHDRKTENYQEFKFYTYEVI